MTPSSPPPFSLLIIEDDDDDAQLVEQRLAQLTGNLRVARASTLAEAQHAMRTERFDLVLADLGLPDSRGVATLRALVGDDGYVPPIIVHSGEAGHAGGAFAWVEKSPGGEELVDAVRVALARARDRADLRALVEANLDAMVVVDVASRRVLFANRACARVLGQPPEALMGEIFGFVSTSQSVVELDVRRSGSVHRIEMRSNDLHWESRPALLHSLRDITDRVRARDYERRLLHSERLVAIGQLAAGVAHEVNNPASFVLNNLEVLEDRLSAFGSGPETTRDEMRELIRESAAGVRRIATIVRQLRAFARFESDELESIDVNELVRATCRMAANEIRYRARLELCLEEVPPLVVQRAQLSQVLLNLLINAAQAIDEGAEDSNRVKVATTLQDRQVVLSVEDTGGGIPKSELERIFDPFFTTKPRDVGTGLGLAVSLETVRKHGGEIRVRSELGEGTRFEVWLPVDSSLRPSKRPQEPRPTLAGDRRRGRILLVDDDEMVRRSLLRLLRGLHEVVLASNGRAALELLAQQDSDFDVILCDLMMPELDGAGLYHEIERRFPEMVERVLFISGGAFTNRVGAFLNSVRPVVLEKPVPRDQLLEEIDRVMPDE
ncbi:MAG: response regulator [Myxococcota bacterium]